MCLHELNLSDYYLNQDKNSYTEMFHETPQYKNFLITTENNYDKGKDGWSSFVRLLKSKKIEIYETSNYNRVSNSFIIFISENDNTSKRVYVVISLLFNLYDIRVISYNKKKEIYFDKVLLSKNDMELLKKLENYLILKMKGYVSLRNNIHLFKECNFTDYDLMKKMTYYEAIFGNYPCL